MLIFDRLTDAPVYVGNVKPDPSECRTCDNATCSNGLVQEGSCEGNINGYSCVLPSLIAQVTENKQELYVYTVYGIACCIVFFWMGISISSHQAQAPDIHVVRIIQKYHNESGHTNAEIDVNDEWAANYEEQYHAETVVKGNNFGFEADYMYDSDDGEENDPNMEYGRLISYNSSTFVTKMAAHHHEPRAGPQYVLCIDLLVFGVCGVPAPDIVASPFVHVTFSDNNSQPNVEQCLTFIPCLTLTISHVLFFSDFSY